MKKLLLIVLCALFVVSCSNKKTVIISGKITGGLPSERVEIIDVSSPATLPIANFATDEKGNFSDTLDLPHNGVYVITYGGNNSYIYLKAGEPLKINGSGLTFPTEFTIDGVSKNNAFLQKSNLFVTSYFSKVPQDIITFDEPKVIDQLKKFKSDIDKELGNIAKTTGADKSVVDWKKGDLDVNLLLFSGQYALMHGQLTNNPSYKPSDKFKNYQKELIGNEEEKVKTYPAYRQYLISNLGEEFQNFVQKKQSNNNTPISESFASFIKDKKYPKIIKDYLIAFVATNFDLRPNANDPEKLIKTLNDNIEDSSVKEGLKKVENAVFGLPVGTAVSSANFVDEANKKVTLSSFKGKPTFLIFYSSWVPYLNESMVPVASKMANAYKSKMNIVFVSLDDNFAQFKKGAQSLLKDVNGTKVYAKKGLNSDIAKEFAIYGFKLPSFVVLDKEGKVASKTFMNIMDLGLKAALDKESGLKIPDIQIQNDRPMTAVPAETKVDSVKTK